MPILGGWFISRSRNDPGSVVGCYIVLEILTNRQLSPVRLERRRINE